MRVGIVGALIGLAVFGAMLLEADGDPFVIVAVAEESVIGDRIETEIGRTVTARPNPGHDGQFFLLQAMDPLVADPFTVEYMWPTRYRGQRMLYPLAAGVGGVVPMVAIPWTMAALQILAYGLGAGAVGELAARRGLNRWWGLAFVLNPGIWGSMQIGGASTMALALGFAAVLQHDRGRYVWAGALFALSLLTRETMVLMLAGVMAEDLIRHRRVRLAMLSIAVLPSAAWAGFLRLQVPDATGDTNGALGLPFNGFPEALEVWTRSSDGLLFGLMTTLSALVLLWRTVVARDVLISACAPFAALFLLLTPSVLRMNFDYSRAVAPVYVGIFILISFALRDATTARLADDVEARAAT
ncbi:MAG: hypothetical protein ACN4GZ_06945 [Acidimicrobiales bacterium]